MSPDYPSCLPPGPAASSGQLRIVVARAELDQAGAALKVASCILERIGNAGRFIENHAVGVVVVGVDFAAAASGQTNDGAQAIEEVIVLAATGQLLVDEQATATTRVVSGTPPGGFVAQTQATVDVAVLPYSSITTWVIKQPRGIKKIFYFTSFSVKKIDSSGSYTHN